MTNHYTQPSRLTLLGYRFAYDPLRAGYLRRLVASLELQGTEQVLVVGSGAGSEAVYLARSLGRGGRVTCLDVSSTWLAEARRRLHGQANVDFVLGGASDAPLSPGTFDLIVAHYVLHDIDRSALPADLRALARAIRRDGRFLVVEPVDTRHGRAIDDLPALMAEAGFTQTERQPLAVPFGAAVRWTFRLS